MKHNLLICFLLLVSVAGFTQNGRKGWYIEPGVGYGSYKLDLYNYNGGSGTYADQKFSQPVVSVGLERKSILEKNRFVLDGGATLTGGFGLTTKSKGAGSGNAGDIKGGWSLGISALAKAGYLAGSKPGAIVPQLGLGPYFISLQSGSGEEGFSSKIYGIQGIAGVEFHVSNIMLMPNIRWGVGSWGNSDRFIGRADNTQNGQPAMFEVGVSAAIRL
ncbi:hypothetical protein SAMN05421788_102144 [Filimonas lacunae]|uniref:Outer membrane protein beta-barrel domain-containing protein n=1 Tax=Filimonas lacunae TaxID=477680 RepID=A0A173MHZ4_9BACT|nr:hypothetical protein [Filimonas lacunae]BAV07234.1 hypothetical protein FLA_3257 [Filimonas lacunae]SIS92825.1 hypothetical protein SAMN05421788_102144 [Filimonas lacunae]